MHSASHSALHSALADFTEARTPRTYRPTNRDLYNLVARRPFLSLRGLCAELWPTVPWSSLTEDLCYPIPQREWQHARTGLMTAAAWIRDRMQDLVSRGALSYGPRRRDEEDVQGQECYLALVAPVIERPSRRLAMVPGGGR